MNFRNHIKTITRKDKEIDAFGGKVIIMEMTGADLIHYQATEDPFLRFYMLFDSCVAQQPEERLTEEMFSNLYKDNIEEVYNIITEILIFSDVVKDPDENNGDKKK